MCGCGGPRETGGRRIFLSTGMNAEFDTRRLHGERRDLMLTYARHNRRKRCECVNCTRYREVEKAIALARVKKIKDDE